MEISLTTPALLFPAVTFLLVAYTNRFLAIGSRIRSLHDRYITNSDEVTLKQIISLKRRVVLIRNMQAFGVGGLFLCVFCMLMLYAGMFLAGKLLFAGSLLFILASLAISLVEIFLSVDALNFELSDLRKKISSPGNRNEP